MQVTLSPVLQHVRNGETSISGPLSCSFHSQERESGLYFQTTECSDLKGTYEEFEVLLLMWMTCSGLKPQPWCYLHQAPASWAELRPFKVPSALPLSTALPVPRARAWGEPMKMKNISRWRTWDFWSKSRGGTWNL